MIEINIKNKKYNLPENWNEITEAQRVAIKQLDQEGVEDKNLKNVWKVGSRWSENGSWESRIISIFRRSNIVFVGTSTERFRNEVREGDYFAIADGYSITSVAKAVSNPIPLSELIEQNLIKVRAGEPFDLKENFTNCYGVKVKIVDLPNDIALWYQKQGTFFKADSIRDEVIKLYEEGLSTQFDIKAYTYRISSTYNQNDAKRSIIDGKTIYNIPVYQREYSWGIEQVSRLVGDIFKGFWGTDENKEIKKEPLFIGTMQLSYKKYISSKESEQDVIDGQQRLSTIICILKYLKLKYPQCSLLRTIKLDWMETRVHNGKEDKYLNNMLSIQNMENVAGIEDYENNRYAQNLNCIRESFDEHTTDENGCVLELFRDNVDTFVEYLLNDIYFVVVETIAGLSKTIQIFNTINTAGLDLNGDDLFKVRLYEYLHDVKNYGEDAFNEIGNIYKSIKDRNSQWRKNHNWDIVSISSMRSIYKYFLISKYKLPISLYSKATDTFFDELFDVLLNVQNHKEYQNVKDNGVDLSLEELKRVEKVMYLWNSSSYRNPEEYISYTLISRSRYSKYINIVYQILLANEEKDENERLTEVYEILNLLARLFFCRSIQYQKAINEVHTFMFNIYRKVSEYEKSKLQILSEIQEKINLCDTDFFKENCIGQVIAENRVWKDLICVLSAYFYELEIGTSVDKMEEMFEGGYDIEHIHANGEECDDNTYELQNSIGNLMVLEYDINRSIGCLPFVEKVSRTSEGLCYKNSKYAVVKNIMTNEHWQLKDIAERRKREIERISKFIFKNNHVVD